MKDLQEKEYQGYQYEGADASFELFVKRRLKHSRARADIA